MASAMPGVERKRTASGQTATFITANGRTQTVNEWARELGLTRQCLQQRMRRGLTGADLIDPNKQTGIGPTTQYVEIDGERMTPHQAAQRYGVPWTTIRRRMTQGLTGPALVAPPRRTGVEYRGQVRSLAEWCRIYNVEYKMVQRRLASGWPIGLALTTRSERARHGQAPQGS